MCPIRPQMLGNGTLPLHCSHNILMFLIGCEFAGDGLKLAVLLKFGNSSKGDGILPATVLGLWCWSMYAGQSSPRVEVLQFVMFLAKVSSVSIEPTQPIAQQ